MANQFNQNVTFSGLGTQTLEAPFAGPYLVKGKISIPTLVAGGGVSSCLVVVNQNGTPVYTGQAGAEGFRTIIVCAALDVLTVVLSSAAAADQPANSIKSTMEFSLGG